jgi:2-polyprenyl-3-methyl-5-hydroxy-6-metoxy-1,4-benzoquinol methylase
MMRYGEEDFDRGYIHWGFTDRDRQRKEAQSVLDIVDVPTQLSILDFGCGIGTHAIHWAKQGHRVVGIDISTTFIEKARETATLERVDASFIVGSEEDLYRNRKFDVVTCIDFPYSLDLLRTLGDLLNPHGWLFFDVRNPKNPDAIAKSSDSQSWEEKDGKFYLQSNKKDLSHDTQTTTWIAIDPVAEVIEECYMIGKASDSKLSYKNAEKLLLHGFTCIDLRTIEGQPHTESTEPYWLWCVACK